MAYDPDKHHRRSIRLKGYDYAQVGAYFVTLCAEDRECLFGDIVAGEMRLNDFGEMVAETWVWLGAQYPYVELDEWVVMPNHLHGIIVIGDDGRGGSRTAPTNQSRTAPTIDSRTAPTIGSGTAPTDKRKPLGRLIGAFKTVSTKRINLMRGTPGVSLWQRNYYEHIIRDEESLNRIRQYILDNPRCWAFDDDNPVAPEPKNS